MAGDVMYSENHTWSLNLNTSPMLFAQWSLRLKITKRTNYDGWNWRKKVKKNAATVGMRIPGNLQWLRAYFFSVVFVHNCEMNSQPSQPLCTRKGRNAYMMLYFRKIACGYCCLTFAPKCCSAATSWPVFVCWSFFAHFRLSAFPFVRLFVSLFIYLFFAMGNRHSPN